MPGLAACPVLACHLIHLLGRKHRQASPLGHTDSFLPWSQWSCWKHSINLTACTLTFSPSGGSSHLMFILQTAVEETHGKTPGLCVRHLCQVKELLMPELSLGQESSSHSTCQKTAVLPARSPGPEAEADTGVSTHAYSSACAKGMAQCPFLLPLKKLYKMKLGVERGWLWKKVPPPFLLAIGWMFFDFILRFNMRYALRNTYANLKQESKECQGPAWQGPV